MYIISWQRKWKNIYETDCFIAATEDEQTNIMSSLLAKDYGMMCKNLVENPEQRTNFWEEKGKKKFKWKKIF